MVGTLARKELDISVQAQFVWEVRCHIFVKNPSNPWSPSEVWPFLVPASIPHVTVLGELSLPEQVAAMTAFSTLSLRPAICS